MIPACMRIIVQVKLLERQRVLFGARNGLRKPCRLWTGAQSKGGKRPNSGPYGSIHIPGVGPVRVHVAAAWAFGLIPDLRVPAGMNIDHGCERTLCIEHDHYAVIPALENQKLRWARRRAA